MSKNIDIVKMTPRNITEGSQNSSSFCPVAKVTQAHFKCGVGVEGEHIYVWPIAPDAPTRPTKDVTFKVGTNLNKWIDTYDRTGEAELIDIAFDWDSLTAEIYQADAEEFLEVTQADIDAGDFTMDHCAVAIRLAEHFNRAAMVGYENIVMPRTSGPSPDRWYRVHHLLRQWLTAYDNDGVVRGPVQPIKIVINHTQNFVEVVLPAEG